MPIPTCRGGLQADGRAHQRAAVEARENMHHHRPGRGPAGTRPGSGSRFHFFIRQDGSSGHRAAVRRPEEPSYLTKTT